MNGSVNSTNGSDVPSSSKEIVAPNRGKVVDISFLPNDIITVPDLRVEHDKFSVVHVSYNELDQFFKTVDKKTKFENLYDVLCVCACHTMYTENGR